MCVVLPPKFRGGIYIGNDVRSMPSIDCSVELKRAMDGDVVRIYYKLHVRRRDYQPPNSRGRIRERNEPSTNIDPR